jgi:4-diphosphocytidyl-2-C-methyl-D-erythritol kinase
LTLTLRAPAKINLALHVTGQRVDGYHLLDSLVVFTDFGDELVFERAGADEVVLDGPYASTLASEDPAKNLVTKARTSLRDHGVSMGYPCPPVKIRLTKCLPIASGIGGGSSDAAAAFLGLAQFWALHSAPETLANIGLGLGADLPMCLIRKPLRAKGIGENLELVSPFPELHLVLVNPGMEVSTPEVFRRLETKTNRPLDAYPQPSSVKAFCNWLAQQRNDLQKPALAIQPAIGDALQALTESGAMLVRMSGSGATCFGIYFDAQNAAIAADKISKANVKWFVQATQTNGALGD